MNVVLKASFMNSKWELCTIAVIIFCLIFIFPSIYETNFGLVDVV
jgi:hypothetical protein